AGGCPPAELTDLRRVSGEHRAEVALGMVFAIKARDHAGYVPPHSAQAATALGDLSADAAVRLADGTAVHDDAGDVPAYELWRQKIRAHFISLPA
ncbi:DUF1702 family protein, partial [Lentzea sp. PSKA42]